MSEQMTIQLNPTDPISIIHRLSGININQDPITCFSISADDILSTMRMTSGNVCDAGTLIRDISPEMSRLGIHVEFGKIPQYDGSRIIFYTNGNRPDIMKDNNVLNQQQMFLLVCRLMEGPIEPYTSMYDFKVTRPNLASANIVLQRFREAIAEDSKLATAMVKEIVGNHPDMDIQSIMEEIEYNKRIRAITTLGYSTEDAEKMLRALNEDK